MARTKSTAKLGVGAATKGAKKRLSVKTSGAVARGGGGGSDDNGEEKKKEMETWDSGASRDKEAAEVYKTLHS